MNTQYVYTVIDSILPRCRNSHTLAPLYPIYDGNGNLKEDPIPIDEVNHEHIWINSEGYAFDINNISILLKTNFRNLNPHTIDAFNGPRYLWCNERDLSSLLFHPHLKKGIQKRIRLRIQFLNLLTNRTKEILASAAGELYSASYQGVYDWIADQHNFDQLLNALGMNLTKQNAMRQLEQLQIKRRNETIKGIRNTLGVQASEHFCEPSGIPRTVPLYDVLEMYKAEITKKLIDYIHGLEKKGEAVCIALRSDFEKYFFHRLCSISQRYAKLYAQNSHKIKHHKIWSIHMEIQIFVDLYYTSIYNSFTFCLREGQQLLHVQENIQSYNVPVILARILDELAFHNIRKIRKVSICGGVMNLRPCKYNKKWRKTIRSDNVFLTCIVHTWMTLNGNYISYLTNIIKESPHDILWNPLSTSRKYAIIQKIYAIYRRDKKLKNIALYLGKNATNIFEHKIIESLRLRSGYDDFSGSLLDKLNGALENRTCIQDVGAELCEQLSVPYAPENSDPFSKFQCDHTNIVSPIIPRYMTPYIAILESI